MCAILGGFFHNPLPAQRIQRALASLAHRGPHGSGLVHLTTPHPAFLGHRLLTISDPTGGHQPIFNESRTIAAVVNGEFYRADEIRQSLEAKGHHFQTQSDSEILIHLYEEHGPNCIHELDGEFAFLLISPHHLFAARDRFGIRPLYYSQSQQGIFFASEERALGHLLDLPCRINPLALSFASHFQYLPPHLTWFEGIDCLPAACTLQTSHPSQTPQIQTYWQEPKPTLEPVPVNLTNHVTHAITRRLPIHVPACTHLSGGLDSSIVSAVTRLPAYCISFPDDPTYNEFHLAHQTAQALTIPLHEVPVSQSDITNHFLSTLQHNSAPFINGHAIAKNLLSQRISSDGFRVALTGEGSDELFFGYGHLWQDYFDQPHPEFSVVGSTPHPARKNFLWPRTRSQLGSKPSTPYLAHFEAG